MSANLPAGSGVAPGRGAAMPHKIATLLYVFDPADRVLLLKRLRPPNPGLWSPPGGKLRIEDGESPWACACREAREELGASLNPSDLRLTGIVSERAYEDAAHWLMFLFEVTPRLAAAPPPMREGSFEWHTRGELESLPVPDTDREFIWPMFWRHRGGFFSAHCRCEPGGGRHWTLEESRPR